MSINEERISLIKSILDDESITAEEDEVLHMLLQERVAQDSATGEKSTLGQRAADKLAKGAGSWGFIIVFFIVLLIWITTNAILLTKPFDPYPFILMNLILSCLAAIQAPVIMMSQNRQEEKDRLRAKNDYKVNLKAEIIIEDIHQKLDAIMAVQQSLIEQISNTDKQAK
ncbi:MAG: DUF1003 domain-containing protein [Eubacteriales bacterium]